jgi:hypothetical protein
MKKLKHIICLVAMAAICFNATAQEKKAAEPSAMDKAWMTYMTPGPMHEMLAKSNGEWNQEVTMWMAPGAPPMKSMSTCTNRMILGNRYQESKASGTFNNMPFEGSGITGYDNAKKVFVSTWIDNMGTGVMTVEGSYDDKTKTINYHGKSVDPMTGKDTPIRETYKIVDDNTQVMEMFMTQNGKEMKTMEIKMTRKM